MLNIRLRERTSIRWGDADHRQMDSENPPALGSAFQETGYWAESGFSTAWKSCFHAMENGGRKPRDGQAPRYDHPSPYGCLSASV